MKRPEERFFAVVENGIVTNIIVGVEDEVVAANPNKFIEYTMDAPAWIGSTRVDGEWIAPKQATDSQA